MAYCLSLETRFVTFTKIKYLIIFQIGSNASKNLYYRNTNIFRLTFNIAPYVQSDFPLILSRTFTGIVTLSSNGSSSAHAMLS